MRGWVVMVLCAWSSAACADAIDDAMAQLEVGEIERATSILDSVVPTDRETLVRVLEARARLAHATRDDDATTTALRALDALDPEHTFGPSVPPELGERLRAMDTPRLSISVTAAELGTGMSLVVRVDDAVGLSRATRLFVRVGAETLDTEERSFAVPLAPGDRAEVWAELRGEGGVVLERWASVDEPHAIVRPATSVNLDLDPGVPPEHEPGDSAGSRRRMIIGIAIAGVVLLAVGGAVGAVVYGKNNRDARLGQPVLID